MEQLGDTAALTKNVRKHFIGHITESVGDIELSLDF